MSQRRGIMTDQLANVIQVLQMGKKSGILMVERGQGATQEDGEIEFVQGQMLRARCGRLSGQPAAEWLATWSLCRYLFTPATTGQITGPLPRIPTEKLSVVVKETSPQLRRFSAPLPTDTTGSFPSVQAGMPNPRRACKDEEARRRLAHAGLSRLHLRLFFLIDGQRGPLELVRLMGRPADEVRQLLHDLEHIGVIQS